MANPRWQLGAGVRLEGDKLVDTRLDRTFSLNQASLLIIAALLRGDGLEEIAAQYARAFGVDPARAQADIRELLTQLERQQLLATRRRGAALARRAAVEQVLRHPAAQAVTRWLQAGLTWYFRLIHNVLGRESVG